MTGMDLLWPALAAVLPGLWSYGRKKRMTWTALALLLLPVLVIVLGVLILGQFHMTWRSVVWQVCGMCFVTGCAMLFVWCGAYLWKEVPGERWHRIAVWLSRLVIVAVIGVPCIGFTMFSSFLALWVADLDHTQEWDGQQVVAQYLWMDGCNYYAYHGPLVRGTEMLEGSDDLKRQAKREEKYRQDAAARETAAKALGLDIPSGVVDVYTDTHGGFHNDGMTFIKMRFSDVYLLWDQVKDNPKWSAMPGPGELSVLAGFVSGNGGEPLFPDLSAMGDMDRYFFQDRFGKAEDASDIGAALARGAYNFTLAVYDSSEQTLYFCQLDT